MLSRLLGKRVRLELDLVPGLGTTRADRTQIDQVLMNLAINARDAMPDGGTVWISTGNDEHGTEEAARLGVEPGRYVTVTVTDTGIGMDEQTRGRAFEPFFTTKPAEEGTGFGLSTAHGIVHQLGGCIWVDSTPGAGSTFRFALPRLDGSVAGETRRWPRRLTPSS